VIKGHGFFEKGMRLEDYWNTLTDEETIMVSEVFFHVLDNLYTSIESDRPKFTNLGWANFLAAVWSQVEDKDYSYQDFLKA